MIRSILLASVGLTVASPVFAETQAIVVGNLIPDAATEKPDQGEIIAVGKGKVADDGKLVAMSVKVGDKVLFGKYAGQTFKMDGVEYMTMREDDIIGVVEA